MKAFINNKELLKKIKTTSQTKLLNGSANEMTGIIFDTLFNNTRFPQFDVNKTTPIDEQGSSQMFDKEKNISNLGVAVINISWKFT